MRNIIIKISEIADGAEASVHPRSFYHGVGGPCYRSRPPAGTQHARGATSHGQSPLRTLKCQKRPTGMPGPRVCRDLYTVEPRIEALFAVELLFQLKEK